MSSYQEARGAVEALLEELDARQAQIDALEEGKNVFVIKDNNLHLAREGTVNDLAATRAELVQVGETLERFRRWSGNFVVLPTALREALAAAMNLPILREALKDVKG